MAFVPEAGDVRAARTILASLGFPAELILQILDDARYWTEVTDESVVHHSVADDKWSLDYSAAYPYLYVQPQLYPDRATGEQPKIREIEFNLVSHDQGWTPENAKGAYETSSWFEASIMRSANPGAPAPAPKFDHQDQETFCSIEQARRKSLSEDGWDMVSRPSSETEPQRLHCPQMKKVTWPADSENRAEDVDEGTHAWYLQGNQVARATSVFEGELVKRYRVIWGSKSNPRFEGNDGAGQGKGFIDSVQKGDWIAIWARAKRRGWENHIFGVRTTIRYTI